MASEQEHNEMVTYSETVDIPRHEQHHDPVRLMRRIMRGRVLIAVVLMTLLGTAGALGGYVRAKILYRSIAQVYVRPNVKPILNTPGASEIPPMFSSYVKAQVSLLRSPETVQMAIDDLVGKASDAKASGNLELELSIRSVASPLAMRDGLTVIHANGEEVINVWFVHEDPDAAEYATNALLQAYEAKYEEHRALRDQFRIETLGKRVENAEADWTSAQSRIDKISEKYGTTDLSVRHQVMVENANRLRARLLEIEDLITLAKAQQNTGEEPDPALIEGPTTLAFLASQDDELYTLVGSHDTKVTQYQSLLKQYGPTHMLMRQLSGEIEALAQRIQLRAVEVETLLASSTETEAIQSLDGTTSLKALENLRAATQTQLDTAQSEIIAIHSDQIALRDNQRDLAAHFAVFDEARAALDRVNLDEAASERVGLVRTTDASTPSYPYSDKRKALAILGGGAGAGLALAMVVGWGLIHRRFRYIDDLKEPSFTAPLLGCLPDLGEHRAASDENTAWSIHQIRNLLQAKAGERPERGNLYAVTSPQSGDGKTSLSLALAISMAKSGKKTVIVDLDLVGKGLTKQLKLDGQPGVREAIAGEHLNGEVVPSKVPGLSVLPTGHTDAVDESNLSSSRLRNLMMPLAQEFDAVILDTGPVLGSLESSLACGLADGVLVTISRGQSESLVESTLQRVRWLGADCVGLVFNRATQKDLRRSHSFSSNASLRSSVDPGDRRKSRREVLVSAVGEQDATMILGASTKANQKRKRRR